MIDGVKTPSVETGVTPMRRGRALLLLPALLMAGCVAADAPPPPPPPPPPPADGASYPTPQPTGGSGGEPQGGAAPTPVPTSAPPPRPGGATGPVDLGDEWIRVTGLRATRAPSATVGRGVSAVPAPNEYCAIASEYLTVEACARLGVLRRSLRKGVGSFSVPGTMYRNETRTVALAIVEGRNVALADGMVATAGSVIHRVADARFGRYMEAELTGEGFEIEPKGRQRKDVFLSSRVLWEWRVTPKRGKVHTLRVAAWVLTPGPNGLGEGEGSFKPVDVNVPIRWYPDRLSDFVDDTTAWFGRGENWFKALTALLIAIGATWAALRAMRGPRAAPA